MVYKLAEQLFVMCALFFYSGALAPFISDENALAGLKQNLPGICTVITLVLIIIHWEKVLPVLFREKTLWLLLLITVASIAWSDIPTQTQGFVWPLLRVTLFGLYFSTRFSLREQLKILVWVFGAAAVGSVIFGALLPTYGVMGVGFIANSQDTTHIGAWRGLFIHKTILGSMMIITGLLCWVNLLMARRKPQLWLNQLYKCGLAIAAVGLWMSTTKGAILVLLIILGLIPFYRALRWSYFNLIPFALIALMSGTVLLAAFITNAGRLLGLIGREVTISGRTIYWPIMWHEIQERFWFGYGYEAFWQGGWRGEVGEVWRFLLPGNEPPHAHNGYLMIWFDIGLVGLLLLAINFLSGYINALRLVRQEHSAIAFAPVTYLTMTFLFNLTESFMMRPDIFWILYLSSLFSVHRELRRHRVRLAHPSQQRLSPGYG